MSSGGKEKATHISFYQQALFAIYNITFIEGDRPKINYQYILHTEREGDWMVNFFNWAERQV